MPEPDDARQGHPAGGTPRLRPAGDGAVELILGNAAYLVFTYLASFYLGRALGPSDFGVLGAVIAAIAVANFASGAGTSQAIPLYLRHVGASGYRAVRAASARAQAWTVLLLCVGMAVAAWALAVLLDDARVTQYMLLGIVTVPLYGALNLALNLLSATGRFRERALANGLSAALRLAATVVFLALGWGIPGAILGYATGAAAAVAYVAVRERRFVHGSSGDPRLGSRTMAAKALGPFLVSMCVFLLFNLDVILVAALGGADVAGRYAALSTLTKVPYYLFAALQTTTLAAVAVDAGAQAREVDFSLRLVLLTWTPALVAIILFPEQILGLTFGEAFATARVPVTLAALGATLVSIATVQMMALAGSDRAAAAAGIAVAATAAGLVAMALLVPGMGILGAGAGLLAAGGVGVVLATASARALVSRLDWRASGLIVLSVAGAALVAMGAAEAGLPWWAALVLGFAVQAAFLAAAKEPTFLQLFGRLQALSGRPGHEPLPDAAPDANAGGRP